MSVTRGEFLKSLGKSLPGMVLNSGVAGAAQKLMTKMAAASGPAAPASPALPDPASPSDVVNATPTDFIMSGPTGGNHVALTFDDGPTPGVTDRILDELQRRGLQATFFMIGRNVEAAPDLARRVAAEGHTIGNHTYGHLRLTRQSDSAAGDDIQKAQDIIASVTGQRPVWFRPPYGALRTDQAPLAEKRGMRVVMWNVDPQDWTPPKAEAIVKRVRESAVPGAIVLCHDLYPVTANCLGEVLDNLDFARYRQVSLDQLFARVS